MALPFEGPISMSMINIELGRFLTDSASLNDAENGSYATINTCSFYRPYSDNPASMSEWYGYNHTQVCSYSYCAGYSDTNVSEVCNNSATCLSSFTFPSNDWTLFRISWTSNDGTDLDILAGYVNTGISAIDTNTIGFGQGDRSVPDGTSISNSYTYWNGDNTGNTGVESVSINFGKLLTDSGSSITNNPIEYRINAWWYSSRVLGNVSFEIISYKNGNPISGNAFNMFPSSDSTLVGYVQFIKNIDTTRTGSISYSNSTTIGYLKYDKVTGKSEFVPSGSFTRIR